MAKDYEIKMVLEGHQLAIDEVIETFIAEVEDFGLTAGGGSTAQVCCPNHRLGGAIGNNRHVYEFVVEDVKNISTVLVVIHSTVIQAGLFDVRVAEISVKEAADG